MVIMGKKFSDPQIQSNILFEPTILSSLFSYCELWGSLEYTKGRS